MTTPYRILITGSRDWRDAQLLQREILTAVACAPADRVIAIVHGNARGADQYAAAVAHHRGWTGEAHPADWGTHGRRAGFIRNAHMVSLGADLCLAFIRHHSRGAAGCAELAEEAGIPTRRFYDCNCHTPTGQPRAAA